MNIFATSSCPYQSAKYLDDKRVVKMCLESAQILSTVMHLYGEDAPYKPTHQNHPCVKWAAESRVNAQWLFRHFQALCLEYWRRYDKQHKCYELEPQFKSFFGKSLVYPKVFENCTDYKEMSNVHLAYKYCLADKWESDKRMPRWYRKGR